ncbi:MAG: bifunctional adenosylcobinamide kinase/adenosylcobinamide-phosphate guanylyltransferase [Candidatus Omnitrophica bacterium]|nr:bifunctional adenosylcobinamide kinase/adenosylcobinamide-phosphate guanylyltransferase [Candidatus Omnitrophota bacterium]MDD5591746.1 bifunctional adenosylcobinamide kinase/adenosylcobinamide-phosphate guanylyltransferase [Candidatus Omnitrophota bacterium]
MAKIIFITGGARSGKSAYALELAKKGKRKVAFIATCQALDKEMAKRINLHKKNRPRNWQTFEEPVNISKLLYKIIKKFPLILLDCLTLLVSNLILKGLREPAIYEEINKVLSELKKSRASAIIVSNEVGLGIVPKNKLGRDFRDIAGKINQFVARESDEVFFMVAGIPLKIK